LQPHGTPVARTSNGPRAEGGEWKRVKDIGNPPL
jgi:hypothetical protein